jgi:DNA-binding GntR family transcriptional regulator
MQSREGKLARSVAEPCLEGRTEGRVSRESGEDPAPSEGGAGRPVRTEVDPTGPIVLYTPSVTRPSGQTSAGTARIRLRDAILDGRLRPGQRLRAETLAIELGTSRTPVREALVALEGEGLVEVEPRRGAVVRSFHADDLLDLYEVRAVLEPHAAARAAERIRPEAIDRLRANCREAEAIDADGTEAAERLIALNVELHGIVLEASASPRLTAAMRSVAGIPSAFRTAFWLSDVQRAASLVHHHELVDALEAGSPERAAAAMRMHVLSARDFLEQVTRRAGAPSSR